MSGRLPAAILAGGLGRRIQPVQGGIPKALIEVGGQPFIAHQLRWLRANGLQRVVVCAGHLGEMIERTIGDGSTFDLSIRFSYDGQRLLGTGGALKKALPLLGDQFFVLYGDSYLQCDLAEVQRTYEACGRLGLMTVHRNDGKWDTSNIEFRNGEIVTYDKRRRTSRMQHIDYGLGVLAQHAFDEVPAGQPYDLADLYQHLLERGQLAAFEAAERFYEIGSPAGLAETERYLAGRS